MSFIFKKALEDELEEKNVESEESSTRQLTFHDHDEEKADQIDFIFSEAKKYKVEKYINQNIPITDEGLLEWIKESKSILKVCELTEKLKALGEPITIESVFYMKKNDFDWSEWIENAELKLKNLTSSDQKKDLVVKNIDSINERKFQARQYPLPFDEFNIININEESLNDMIKKNDEYIFYHIDHDFDIDEYFKQLEAIIFSYYRIAKRYKTLLSRVSNPRIKKRIGSNYDSFMLSFKNKYFYFYNVVNEFLNMPKNVSSYAEENTKSISFLAKEIDKNYLKEKLLVSYPYEVKKNSELLSVIKDYEEELLNYFQEEYLKRYEYYSNEENYWDNGKFYFFEEDVTGHSFQKGIHSFGDDLKDICHNFVFKTTSKFVKEKMEFKDYDVNQDNYDVIKQHNEYIDTAKDIFQNYAFITSRALREYFYILFFKVIESTIKSIKGDSIGPKAEKKLETMQEYIIEREEEWFAEKLSNEIQIYKVKMKKEDNSLGSPDSNLYTKIPGFEKITFKDISKTNHDLSIESAVSKINISEFINSSIFKEFFSFGDSIKLNENIEILNSFLIEESYLNLNSRNNFFVMKQQYIDINDFYERNIIISCVIDIVSDLMPKLREFFIDKIKVTGYKLQNEYVKSLDKKEYNISSIFMDLYNIYYSLKELNYLKDKIFQNQNQNLENSISFDLNRSFYESSSQISEVSWSEDTLNNLVHLLKSELNYDSIIGEINKEYYDFSILLSRIKSLADKASSMHNPYSKSVIFSRLNKVVSEPIQIKEVEDKSKLSSFFEDNKIKKTGYPHEGNYEFDDPKAKNEFSKKIMSEIKRFIVENKSEFNKKYKAFCTNVVNKIPKSKFKKIIDEIIKYYNTSKKVMSDAEDIIYPDGNFMQEDYNFIYRKYYYDEEDTPSELLETLESNLNRYRDVYLNSFDNPKEKIDAKEITCRTFLGTVAYDIVNVPEPSGNLDANEKNVLSQLIIYFAKNVVGDIIVELDESYYDEDDQRLVTKNIQGGTSHFIFSGVLISKLDRWFDILKLNIDNESKNKYYQNIWDDKTKSEVFKIVEKIDDTDSFIQRSKNSYKKIINKLKKDPYEKYKYYYLNTTSNIPHKSFLFPDSLLKSKNLNQSKKQINLFIKKKLSDARRNLMISEFGEKKYNEFSKKEKVEKFNEISERPASLKARNAISYEDEELYKRSSMVDFMVKFKISNKVFSISFEKHCSFFSLDNIDSKNIEKKKEIIIKELRKIITEMLYLNPSNFGAILKSNKPSRNYDIIGESSFFNFSHESNLDIGNRAKYGTDYGHGFGMFDSKIELYANDGRNWEPQDMSYSNDMPITLFLQNELKTSSPENETDYEGSPDTWDEMKDEGYKKVTTSNFIIGDIAGKTKKNKNIRDSRFIISKDCFRYNKEEGKSPIDSLSINITDFNQIERLIFNHKLLTNLNFEIIIEDHRNEANINNALGLSISNKEHVSKCFELVTKYINERVNVDYDQDLDFYRDLQRCYGYENIVENYDQIKVIKDYLDQNRTSFSHSYYQNEPRMDNLNLFEEVLSSPIQLFDLVPTRENLSRYNAKSFNYIEYCEQVINSLYLRNKEVFINFLEEARIKFNKSTSISSDDDLLYNKIFYYIAKTKRSEGSEYPSIKMLDLIITCTNQSLINILKELKDFDLKLYDLETQEVIKIYYSKHDANSLKYKNIEYLFDILKNSNTSYKNKILFLKSLLITMHNNSSLFEHYRDSEIYTKKVDRAFFDISQLASLNVIENLNKTLGLDYLNSMIEACLIMSNSKLDSKNIDDSQKRLVSFGIKNLNLEEEVDIIRKLSSFEFAYEDVLTEKDIREGNTRGKIDIGEFRRMVRRSKFALSLLKLGNSEIKFFEENKDVVKDERLYDLDMSYDEKIRFRVLRTGDVYILKAGIDTDCCQQLGGIGSGAAVDSFVNDKASVLLLEAKKSLLTNSKFKEISKKFPETKDGYILISQSYFHIVDKNISDFPSNYNNSSIDKYIILDNIESNLDNISVSYFAREFGLSYTNLYKALGTSLRKKGYGGLICGVAYTKPWLRTKRSKMGKDPRKIAVDSYSSPYDSYTDFLASDFYNLTDESDDFEEDIEKEASSSVSKKILKLEKFLKFSNIKIDFSKLKY